MVQKKEELIGELLNLIFAARRKGKKEEKKKEGKKERKKRVRIKGKIYHELTTEFGTFSKICSS